MNNSKKGIEDALGIPSVDELQKAMDIINSKNIKDDPFSDEEIVPLAEYSTEEIKTAITATKKVRNDMLMVPDVIESENQIARISDKAEKHFEDIIHRAFNAEGKNAAELIKAADMLLATALEGRTAILEAKVKLLNLELSRQRLAIQNPGSSPDIRTVDGTDITIADRNTLLKKKK